MSHTFSLRRWTASALLLALAPFANAQATASDPLLVQEIRCAGNEQTSCEFIGSHLHLHAGDRLDEEEIRNAELRLSALRNFESVSIRLEKGAERGAVIVLIAVAEASPVTTEWLLGAASLPGIDRGVFAGRIGHQNLFGKGKIADLSAEAITPIAGDEVQEGYGVSLRYADPQLFGSSRYFGIVSAGWNKSRFEGRYADDGYFEGAGVNLAVGRRFGDFSYVMLELNHRPDSDWSYSYWEHRVLQRREFHGSGTKATLIYGWSSEDDLHFPTQGSALQLAVRGDFGAKGPDRYPFLRYRKTWQWLGGYWSAKIGGEPSPEFRSALSESQPFALTYSRSLAPGGFVQRGRWYVEPGFSLLGSTPEGHSRYGYGLKAGVRAETRHFGIVDLYLLGVGESTP